MNQLPRLVQPRAPEGADQIFEPVGATGRFDPDAWHVMQRRDNALIEDEILHGASSAKFVYSFDISGTSVTGISVVGARHLAAHYGGIKHRIVASVQKSGSLFTFRSYPHDNMPMRVLAESIPQLSDEPDFYEAIVEIFDVKTGNSIQVERRENRLEQRRDKSTYERPHYATIAQAKAYRNGVLAIIPQDILIKWREAQLRLGRNETITADVLGEKRSGVLRFGAARAIPLERGAVEALTLDQIAGLSDAAHTGNLTAFAQAAQALGLVQQNAEDGPPATTGLTAPKRGPGRPRKDPPPSANSQSRATTVTASEPTDDPISDEQETEPEIQTPDKDAERLRAEEWAREARGMDSSGAREWAASTAIKTVMSRWAQQRPELFELVDGALAEVIG
jgi:hypothetical protein